MNINLAGGAVAMMTAGIVWSVSTAALGKWGLFLPAAVLTTAGFILLGFAPKPEEKEPAGWAKTAEDLE